MVRVEMLSVAPQRHGEVESETVDSDFVRPVAQRVERQEEHGSSPEIERVAASRGVHEASRVVRLSHVIGGVVDAPPRNRRPVAAAFARVVVDDVEDHLDSCLVQGRDHALDLVYDGLGAGLLCGLRRVAGFGGEEIERAVAPIVGQSDVRKEGLVHLGLNRQKFDSRDSQSLEVVDGGGVGQAGVGSPELLRDALAQRRYAFDVAFVDDGVAPRNAGVMGDGLFRFRHNAEAHERSGVKGVGVEDSGAVQAEPRREEGAVENGRARDGFGVRVQKKLGRIVEESQFGRPAPGDAVSVALPDADAGNVARPKALPQRVECESSLAAGVVAVEKAQRH